MGIEGMETRFTVNSQGNVVIPKIERPLYDATSEVFFKEESKGDSPTFELFIPCYKTRQPLIPYTYNAQNDVVFTIKRDDNTNYPTGTTITFPGVEGTYTIPANGIVTIPNASLPIYDTTGVVVAKESNREASFDLNFVMPGRKTNTPTVLTSVQDINGNVVITPRKPNGQLYPAGTILTSPALTQSFTIGEDGTFYVESNNLPENTTLTNLYFKAPNKETSDGYEMSLLGSSTGPKDVQKANLESLYNGLKTLIEENVYLTSEEKNSAIAAITTIHTEGQSQLDNAVTNEELDTLFNQYKASLEASALTSVKEGNLNYVDKYTNNLVTSYDQTLTDLIENGEVVVNSMTTITNANLRTENLINQITNYINQEVQLEKVAVELDLSNFAGDDYSDEVEQIINEASNLVTSKNYNQPDEVDQIIEDAKVRITEQLLLEHKETKKTEVDTYVDSLVTTIDPALQTIITTGKTSIDSQTSITNVDTKYTETKAQIDEYLRTKVDETRTSNGLVLETHAGNNRTASVDALINQFKDEVTSMNYNNQTEIETLVNDYKVLITEQLLLEQKQATKNGIDTYVDSLVTAIDPDLQSIIDAAKTEIDNQTLKAEVELKESEAKAQIDAYLATKLNETKSTNGSILENFAGEQRSQAVENLISEFKNKINTSNYNNNSALETLVNEYKALITQQLLLEHKQNAKSEIDNFVGGLVTTVDPELQSIINDGKSLIDNVSNIASVDSVLDTTKSNINNYLTEKTNARKEAVSSELVEYESKPYSEQVQAIIDQKVSSITSQNYNNQAFIDQLITEAKAEIDQQKLMDAKNEAKAEIDAYLVERVRTIDPELQTIIDNAKTSIDSQTTVEGTKTALNDAKVSIDAYLADKVATKKEEVKEALLDYADTPYSEEVLAIIDNQISFIDEQNYNFEQSITYLTDEAKRKIDEQQVKERRQNGIDQIDQFVNDKLTVIDPEVQEMIDQGKQMINNDKSKEEVQESVDITINRINEFVDGQVEIKKERVRDQIAEYTNFEYSLEIQRIIESQADLVTSQTYNNDASLKEIIDTAHALIDEQLFKEYQEQTKREIDTEVNNKVLIIDEELQAIIDEGKALIDNVTTKENVDTALRNTVTNIELYLQEKLAEKQAEVRKQLEDYAGKPLSEEIQKIINENVDLVTTDNYNNQQELDGIILDTKTLIDNQLLKEAKNDAKKEISDYVDTKVSKVDEELKAIIDQGNALIDDAKNEAEIKDAKNELVDQINEYIDTKVNDLKEALKESAKEKLAENTDPEIEEYINKIIEEINSGNYNDETFLEDINQRIDDAISIHLNTNVESSKTKVKEDLETYAGTPITEEIRRIIDAQVNKVTDENYKNVTEINQIIEEGKALIDEAKLNKDIEDKVKELEKYLENENISDELKKIIEDAIIDISNSKSKEELDNKYNEIINEITHQLAIDGLIKYFEEIYQKYKGSGRYNDDGLKQLETIYNETIESLRNDDLTLAEAVEKLNDAQVMFANIKTVYVFSDSLLKDEKDESKDVYMSVSNSNGFKYGTSLRIEKVLIDPAKHAINEKFASFTKIYKPFTSSNATYDFNQLKDLTVLNVLDINLFDEKNVIITEFNGEYIVRFLATPEMKDMTNYTVVYVLNNELTVFETKVDNGWVTFKTTHFSEFIVMGEEDTTSKMNLMDCIIKILLGVIGLELIIIFFKKRSNNKKLRSIVFPVLFLMLSKDVVLVIIAILALIIICLFIYIVYLFMKGRKIYREKIVKKVTEERFEVSRKYDVSYTGKLHQLSDKSKKNYSELKNYINSFKEINSLITWENETFSFDGKALFKFIIHENNLKIQVLEKYIKHANLYSDNLKELNVENIKKIISIIVKDLKLKYEPKMKIIYNYQYKSNQELLEIDLARIIYEGDKA